MQRSEEHLSTLFEQTAAGIAERDLEGRLIRVNERLCQILGRTREQVLGINIHELTHPDDRARSIAAFHQLLVDGQPFSIEKRYLRPDGTAVWVSTTVSPIRQSAAQQTGSVLAVIVEIKTPACGIGLWQQYQLLVDQLVAKIVSTWVVFHKRCSSQIIVTL
ncbi:PAS domain-containing protein [Pseudoduganella sp. UC29_106]|uniref:PAS domain-containing protein n=1 Tax=Pseudoduganella sp. UC29_106 TaxID=3374553 RepID=UPI0037576B81